MIYRRRLGRGWFLGPFYVGIQPWQATLAIGRSELFVRPWSGPCVQLILRTRCFQIVLGSSHGYIGDLDLTNLVPLYGSVT